jgi:hypothetical protein
MNIDGGQKCTTFTFNKNRAGEKCLLADFQKIMCVWGWGGLGRVGAGWMGISSVLTKTLFGFWSWLKSAEMFIFAEKKR